MAVDIYNRTGHPANGGKSPYEMYIGRPPPNDSRYKRSFGCVCYVHKGRNHKKRRARLAATAKPCIYMGPSNRSNRDYYVFSPRRQQFWRMPPSRVTFGRHRPGGYLVMKCSSVLRRRCACAPNHTQHFLSRVSSSHFATRCSGSTCTVIRCTILTP